MRDRLISVGIKQLRESYPGVNRNNILVDRVYAAFFKSSLESTIEDAGGQSRIADECRKLIAEIDQNMNPPQ